MCFAGEAALFFGLGTVVIEQSAGSYLPGTKISDPRIQGFIVCVLWLSFSVGFLPPATHTQHPPPPFFLRFLGLYYLTSTIAGFDSVVRRNRCSALVAYAQMALDFVLSCAISVITWWAGGSFQVFAFYAFSLIPSFYMLLVLRSWYLQLLRESAGPPVSVALPPSGAGGAFGEDDEISEEEVRLDVGSVGAQKGGGGGGGGGGGAPAEAASAAAGAPAPAPVAPPAPLLKKPKEKE